MMRTIMKKLTEMEPAVADLSIYNRKSLFLSDELFNSKKIFISAKNHSQNQSKRVRQNPLKLTCLQFQICSCKSAQSLELEVCSVQNFNQKGKLQKVFPLCHSLIHSKLFFVKKNRDWRVPVFGFSFSL